ncbi:MAG: DUF6448 family protein [Sedimentibacter sp.]
MNSKKIITTFAAAAVAVGIIVFSPLTANAHCDTMDGPTVADGIKAMDENNINHVLKWVMPEYEEEITEKFNLSMKAKDSSPESKELAEQYFFSELVRLHRAGEGAPFDGLKPSGTPIDEKVAAADESIAVGNLSPLEGLIEEEKMPELTERFEKVMELKDFDVNNVEEGRGYIEAYVSFFKFAEGEEEHHGEAVHSGEAVNTEELSHETEEVSAETTADTNEEKSSTNWLPWALAGLFFTTNIIAHAKLFHLKKHSNGQCNHH